MKKLEIAMSDDAYAILQDSVRQLKVESVKLILKCVVTDNADNIDLIYTEVKK